MNKLWKLLAAMLVLTMFSVALAGCATPVPPAEPAPTEPAAEAADTPEPAEPAAEPAEEVKEEIVLRMGLGAEPSSIDPNLAQDTYAINTLEGIFLGLTNINNETGEIEPELATGWDVSEDGLVWTFSMRDDVMWTDGNPVTAHDIEYSVKRAVMPETASPYAYVL